MSIINWCNAYEHLNGCDDVSSARVDQLFAHLSQQLVEVRSSLSDAIQRRYDYYTSLAGEQIAQLVDDISRQLTALRAVVDYTEKVFHRHVTRDMSRDATNTACHELESLVKTV